MSKHRACRMNEIIIKNEMDIVTARSIGREMAREMGFMVSNQTRLATAISELTRNIIKYAGHGTCKFFDESNDVELEIRAVVEDSGPGIADINQAMKDGFTTGKSLGAGLPGTKRLVKEMVIKSEPGLTTIQISISQIRK